QMHALRLAVRVELLRKQVMDLEDQGNEADRTGLARRRVLLRKLGPDTDMRMVGRHGISTLDEQQRLPVEGAHIQRPPDPDDVIATIVGGLGSALDLRQGPIEKRHAMKTGLPGLSGELVLGGAGEMARQVHLIARQDVDDEALGLLKNIETA